MYIFFIYFFCYTPTDSDGRLRKGRLERSKILLTLNGAFRNKILVEHFIGFNRNKNVIVLRGKFVHLAYIFISFNFSNSKCFALFFV